MATVVVPPTSSAVVEPTMADLRKWAETDFEGDMPAPPAAETKPAETAETPAPPATPAGETKPPASEPGKPQEPAEGTTPEEEDDKTPIPPGVQKRIDKAVRKQREAERRLEAVEARLQQIQAPPPAQPTAQPAAEPAKPADTPPDPKNYTDWDKYQQDLTNYTIDQREKAKQAEQAQRAAQERSQALTESWNSSVEAARAKHADYDDVMDTVKDLAQKLPPEMHRAVIESEGDVSKAELAYALAKNRPELERISKLPPHRLAFELGAFVAKLQAPPAPKTETAPPAPPLPKPPKSVGGSGSAATEVDLEKTDMRTFKREIKKYL
jgi:hypothetical protein